MEIVRPGPHMLPSQPQYQHASVNLLTTSLQSSWAAVAHFACLATPACRTSFKMQMAPFVMVLLVLAVPSSGVRFTVETLGKLGDRHTEQNVSVNVDRTGK